MKVEGILFLMLAISIVVNIIQANIMKDLKFWRDHYRKEYDSVNKHFNSLVDFKKKLTP